MSSRSEYVTWEVNSLLSKETERRYLDQVIQYYHESLLNDDEAMEYLRQRGIENPVLLSKFKVGFADRTVGKLLPRGTTVKGETVRGILERYGLYKNTGHELLRGCVVFPIFNESGDLVNAYGRRINYVSPGKGTPYRVINPRSGSFFNEEVLENFSHVILTSTPIEALTLMGLEVYNVFSTLGIMDFNQAHVARLEGSSVKQVDIVFANTILGNRRSIVISEALKAIGIASKIARLPRGDDVNKLYLKTTVLKRMFSNFINPDCITVH